MQYTIFRHRWSLTLMMWTWHWTCQLCPLSDCTKASLFKMHILIHCEDVQYRIFNHDWHLTLEMLPCLWKDWANSQLKNTHDIDSLHSVWSYIEYIFQKSFHQTRVSILDDKERGDTSINALPVKDRPHWYTVLLNTP